jgi:hypothetical protein
MPHITLFILHPTEVSRTFCLKIYTSRSAFEVSYQVTYAGLHNKKHFQILFFSINLDILFIFPVYVATYLNFHIFSNNISIYLLSRLRPYIDEIIGDHQCGFRRNRSTTDQIFCIQQILEKKWEYNETVHQLFVDFKKAYDSVRREVT